MVLDGTIRKRFAPPSEKTVWKLAAAMLETTWVPPSADLQKSIIHAANKAVSRHGRQSTSSKTGSSANLPGRKASSRVLTRVGTFRRGKGTRTSLLPALSEHQALEDDLAFVEGSSSREGGRASAMVPFQQRRPSSTSATSVSTAASKSPVPLDKDEAWAAELRQEAERAVARLESSQQLLTWQQLLVKVDASHLSMPVDTEARAPKDAQDKLAEARDLFTGINTRSYFGQRIAGEDEDEHQGSKKDPAEEAVDHQVLNLLAKKKRRRASVEGFKSLVGKALHASQRERGHQDKRDIAAVATAVATDRLQQMLTSPLLRGAKPGRELVAAGSDA